MWKNPPEETNQDFSAEPLFTKEEFDDQYLNFKLYVFRHFIEDNPVTRRAYTTKDVLSIMIKDGTLIIKPGTVLRKFVDAYRLQCITSISVERLFKAYTYLDTAQVQGRTPDNVDRMLISYKELPIEELYDLDTTGYLLSLSQGNVAIPPPINDLPTGEKQLIKSMDDIQRARAGGKDGTYGQTFRFGLRR